MHRREHFSHSMMMSVSVSKVGKTSVMFIDLGTKVDSNYYYTRVLGQSLLLHTTAVCVCNNWTLQQDSVPSHSARKLSHTDSPDLNLVDCAIWGALQE